MLNQKYCPSCKKILSAVAFAADASRCSGLRVYCRPCGLIKTKENRNKDRPAYRAKANKYRAAKKDVINENARARRSAIKLGILNKFWNGSCVKCGFSDPRALQIDHIHGGGGRERAAGVDSHMLYAKIFKMPYELVCEKYQALCANCNWIKRIEERE